MYNEDLSFEEFRKDKQIITDPTEIANKVNELDFEIMGNVCELHLYGNAYWLCKDYDGMYWTIIVNDTFDSCCIEDVEKELYQFIFGSPETC